MRKIKQSQILRDEYYLILMKKYNINDSEAIIEIISTEENLKREHFELLAMGIAV